MSTNTDEIPTHIDPVDVDLLEKENVTNNEKTGRSDDDSSNSCTGKLSSLQEGVLVPGEDIESGIEVDLKNETEKISELVLNTTLSSPTSVNPNLSTATRNVLDFNDLSTGCSDLNSSSIENFIKNINDVVNLPENEDRTAPTFCVTDSNDEIQSTDQVLMEKSEKTPIFTIENTKFENPGNKSLTTSTASLNDHCTRDNEHTAISKSLYSRSVDDLCNFEQNVTTNLTCSTKELNPEKILTEFQSQKNKAAATQKIIPEQPKNTEPQTDLRYARIPKELLPQDLGSLVKNVHGIFSSVSGSLKYAYNQTQRAPKPPIKALPRHITNSKVMNDIFEDQGEKISSQICVNDIEKTPADTIIPTPEVKENEPIREQTNAEEKEGEKGDPLKLQIESLERVLAEQRKENASLQERVKQQDEELHGKEQRYKEMENRLELMGKRVEHADREKDAAVMRYCSVECAAIEARKAAEKAQAAERAALNEMELMNNKLKSAHSEKARICQLYDDKCHELSTSERELAKLREDVKELEGRLKWTQSKLRMEIDAYKDRAERAEKLEKQVAELELARDAAAASATDSARAKLLELELKESQAALILCRHEKAELEKRLSSVSHQLDSCTRERDNNSAALATALADIERLKESNLRLEEEAAELAALRAQAALADTLSAQLARETERASAAEAALSSERARAETCARREAAALEHAAVLTAQHVQSRARTSDNEHKAQALCVDNASLRARVRSLEEETTRMRAALGEQAERRARETRALARKVAELTEELADANKRLEWEQGEIEVLKKKHANAVKELNRELQRALKRCEQLEAKLPADSGSARTGSISSLSSGEGTAPQQDERLQNGHSDALPDIQVREPDRQALIERIVSLQRAAARRSERCEFLEEHSKQLTAELRAKAKLLRHLLCALPAGAVASTDSDAHKKEIARLGGGAMAAVWGGERGGMTLELSLEMNTKLQAVLEDALLKNITLKENLDTLGEEIARLKEQRNGNSE